MLLDYITSDYGTETFNTEGREKFNDSTVSSSPPRVVNNDRQSSIDVAKPSSAIKAATHTSELVGN